MTPDQTARDYIARQKYLSANPTNKLTPEQQQQNAKHLAMLDNLMSDYRMREVWGLLSQHEVKGMYFLSDVAGAINGRQTMKYMEQLSKDGAALEQSLLVTIEAMNANQNLKLWFKHSDHISPALDEILQKARDDQERYARALALSAKNKSRTENYFIGNLSTDLHHRMPNATAVQVNGIVATCVNVLFENDGTDTTYHTDGVKKIIQRQKARTIKLLK